MVWIKLLVSIKSGDKQVDCSDIPSTLLHSVTITDVLNVIIRIFTRFVGSVVALSGFLQVVTFEFFFFFITLLSAILLCIVVTLSINEHLWFQNLYASGLWVLPKHGWSTLCTGPEPAHTAPQCACDSVTPGCHATLDIVLQFGTWCLICYAPIYMCYRLPLQKNMYLTVTPRHRNVSSSAFSVMVPTLKNKN